MFERRSELQKLVAVTGLFPYGRYELNPRLTVRDYHQGTLPVDLRPVEAPLKPARHSRSCAQRSRARARAV